MAWHDESQTRVTRVTVTPGQIEMLSAPSLAPHCVPAGRELRAARDANAARIPLTRLPAPVFGWNADDETLATLLAAAGRRTAAPDRFYPRAKTKRSRAPRHFAPGPPAH